MGTIAQKLEYLNDTRLLLKDNINKINNVLDDNSTFRSYPQELFNGYLDILNNGTDTLWSNLEKVSASGEEATLENVETAPIKMVLNGNTSQDTTSGKQLLDTTIYSLGSINGNTGQNEESSSIYRFDKYNEVNSNTTIYLLKHLCIYFYNENKGFISSNITGNLTITTPPNTKYIRFRIFGADFATFNPNDYMVSYTQETHFEPYTGGQPSPNPDFPQQVKVVKGENAVSVQGKNLIDKNGTQTISAGAELSILDTGIRATITTAGAFKYVGLLIPNSDKLLGKTITLSANIEKSGNNTPAIYLYELTSDNQLVKNVAGISFTTQSRSFTLPKTYSTYNDKTASKFGLLIYGNTNGTGNIGDYVDYKDLQIEYGSTATPYVPYSKTDYPISLGTLELCKIGDYKDYLFKRNGKWYVHKEVGKVALDGTEGGWNLNYTSTQKNIIRYAIDNLLAPDIKKSSGEKLVISNYFKGVSSNETNSNVASEPCISGRNVRGLHICVYLNDSNMNTLELFKTWLSTHNTIVYYVLATPTEEEITNTTLISQLEAISKAKSVKDKTYITQTNEELPFILDVEAIKEYEVN